MQEVIYDPTHMSTFDMAGLEALVRDHAPDLSLEIGSWKGMSSAIIARHSRKLFCIDRWEGSDNAEALKSEASQRDVLSIFIANMKAQGVWNKVFPFIGHSYDLSDVFIKPSFDFIFIDGSHAYTDVKQDIDLTLTYLLPGGIIAGHDLEILWRDCDENLRNRIENEQNQDLCNEGLGAGKGLHPGVTKAIFDAFADDVNVIAGTTIWWKKI